uniref:Arrestin-like N-terminal domain-containing protein n=1 Tax=Schizophyllum commune (strain H4-8 / FGSC 9210) TaxID=578458 RepID=D8PY08_SCHCM
MSDLLAVPSYSETKASSSSESLLGDLTPPRYTPSPPAPHYTSEPKRDELTLQEARRPNALPSGSFVTSAGPLTLEIAHQVDGVSTPTLNARGRLRGTLALDMRDRSSIIGVTLTLSGRMILEAAGAGRETVTLLKETHDLWLDQGPVPSLVPIDIVVPSTFVDNDGEVRSLPPSCDFTDEPMGPAAPVSAQVAYNLSIVVERERRHGIFSQTKSLTTPFELVPRTRPDHGIIPVPSFFSTMKTSPEEWHQAVSEIATNPASGVQSLKSHLFLPAGKVYWIGDAIPFHLSVTGPSTSLHALFPSESAAGAPSTGAQITVKVLRQIAVTARKHRAVRNVIIGHGTLRSVEPFSSARGEQRDWDGFVQFTPFTKSVPTIRSVLSRSELKMDNNSTVCGFNVGSLVVKDFIVLEIKPVSPATSPFHTHQNPVFVRFTTDPYVESYGPDQPS